MKVPFLTLWSLILSGTLSFARGGASQEPSALDPVSSSITRNTHDVPSSPVILTPHTVSAIKVVFKRKLKNKLEECKHFLGEKKVLQLCRKNKHL